MRRTAAALCLLLACAGGNDPSTPTRTSTHPAGPSPTTGGATAPAAPATTPAAPATAPPAPAGDDFAAEVTVLYRVGACGGDGPVPDRLDARRIERHCASMRRRYAAYRKAWADRAGAFIGALRPADLPTTVVYPFGGGDLASALVVFPDATEITTLSLEASGDVRVIDTIASRQLADDLSTIGHDIGRLFRSAHSTTKSLQGASHSLLPGTVLFALAALAVHDLEPVSLRYFDLEPDGSIHYLTGAELDRRAAAAVPPAPVARAARTPVPRGTVRRLWREQQSVFANVEIGFRPRSDPTAPVRIYRHLVANLDDEHLGADRRALAHLEAKGQVAAMTKAASFLLWYDDFSQIRDYLLGHVTWMISDASGIPPRHAGPAGFEQVTYGTFVDAYFIKDPNNTRRELRDLWQKNPHRDLPFRFGYPDAEDHPHLMITRRP